MSGRVSDGRREPLKGRAGHVFKCTFSMQEADSQLIEALRVRCAKQGMLMDQSEVVRVGLRVLAEMCDEELRQRV